MAKRKTIEVEKIKKMVNHHLEHSKTSPAERVAVAGLLENILHETNNYRGFIYLMKNWKDDESRRRYI